MKGLDGRFEVTVKAAGALPLPAQIAYRLALVPGDLFSLRAEPNVLYLGIYKEFLANNGEAFPAENRWRDLKKFLSQPLTALDRRRALAIPEEVFPLRKGDKVWLYVTGWGLQRSLFLFRKAKSAPKPRTRECVVRAAAGSVRDGLTSSLDTPPIEWRLSGHDPSRHETEG
jgi:hypothetical protein